MGDFCADWGKAQLILLADFICWVCKGTKHSQKFMLSAVFNFTWILQNLNRILLFIFVKSRHKSCNYNYFWSFSYNILLHKINRTGNCVIARNSSFLKIKHKIDFAKKLFNYENTGRKKEAGKNIRKSETIVSLPTCECSNAS